jgi:hypothetical protein
MAVTLLAAPTGETLVAFMDLHVSCIHLRIKAHDLVRCGCETTPDEASLKRWLIPFQEAISTFAWAQFGILYLMQNIDIHLSLCESGDFSIEINGKSHENIPVTIAEDLVMCAMIRAEDFLLEAAGREREIVD